MSFGKITGAHSGGYGAPRRAGSYDKFGRPVKIIGCKDNGNGYGVGILNIGNQAYKVEPSEANKDGIVMWVKFTKLEARRKQQSNF